MKKQPTHNRFLVVLCIIILATFIAEPYAFIPGEAHAQAVSLRTYPSTLHLRGKANETVKSTFTVENKTPQSVKLEVMIKPFKADAANDGKVFYLEGNEPPLLQRVEIINEGFSVKSLELGPRQSKQVSLAIKLNPSEPIADYYFSIILLAGDSQKKDDTQNEAAAYTLAQTGIATNVLLSVGPKELPMGYLEEFSTPTYRDSGPVPFTVKIRNKGPHYITPKGVILIKNIFGQTVGKINIQNANILAGTARSLASTSNNSNANITLAKNEIIQPQHSIWTEKFLLGIYRAELSIALSEEGPLINQTIHFAAFPAKLLGIFALALGIGIMLALRIRRRLRET